MSRIVLIAALDQHRAIGRGNRLPWHLPADLQHFKQRTLGKPVLMGRKTAESIGRALPGRENLVLTRSAQTPAPEQRALHSIEEALALPREELIVIGGAALYEAFMPHATDLWLTHVNAQVTDPDRFFPAIDSAQWRITQETTHPSDAHNAHAMRFVDYVRRGGLVGV